VRHFGARCFSSGEMRKQIVDRVFDQVPARMKAEKETLEAKNGKDG